MSSSSNGNHHQKDSTFSPSLSRRVTSGGAENLRKVTDCLEESKKHGRDNVPSTCEQFLQQYEHQETAWAGASFADRVHGTSANLQGYKNPFRVEKDYIDPAICNPNINASSTNE
jgi:hypothetical protein